MTVALLLVGLLPGCARHSQKWIGTWEGDLKRVDASMPDDDVKRTINLVRVTILRDGTFQMMESGIAMTGTHNLGGERASLTIRKRLGEPLDGSKGAKITLRWQEDGSVLLTDPDGFDGRPVRLTLQSQP